LEWRDQNPLGVLSRVEDWRGEPLTGLRFQSPLVEPDMRISRIRLSDKNSCGRPRTVLGKKCEPHEAQATIEVIVRIPCKAVTAHLVLTTQPPT
jgi:hypothetical protein